MESVQSWISNHKLTSIGTLWATAVGASLAYNSHPSAAAVLKPSLRLIHARMHAQALTLAVLSSAAAYHYYDKNYSNSTQQQQHNKASIHWSDLTIAGGLNLFCLLFPRGRESVIYDGYQLATYLPSV